MVASHFLRIRYAMHEHSSHSKAGNKILEMAHHTVLYDDRTGLYHELVSISMAWLK